MRHAISNMHLYFFKYIFFCALVTDLIYLRRCKGSFVSEGPIARLLDDGPATYKHVCLFPIR